MKNIYILAKQKFNDKFFSKIYLSVCLPVLLVYFVFACEMFAYVNKNVSNVKISYSEKLDSMYSSNERSLDNITMLVNMLFDNTVFYDAATSHEISESAATIGDLLANVKQVNPFIDSIAVYDKGNQEIYTDSGMVDADLFFSTKYIYSDYPKSFWDNYKSVMFSRRVIAPSEVTTPSGTKTVIPMVFTKLTNKYLSNLVIVNIDAARLLQNSSDEKISAGSNYFIVNKQRKTVYSQSGVSDIEFSDDFYDKLNLDRNIFFTTKINEKKYIIIGQSPTDSILGYTYIASIPYNDVYIGSHFMLFTFIFVAVLLLAVLIILVFVTSGHIYEPIHNLMFLFPKSKSASLDKKSNLLSSLQSEMENIISNNDMLSDKYTRILPLAQEKQLIDLLNQNKHYNFDLKNVDINFPHKYFCVIVYKLIPTRIFYTSYTRHDYTAIKDGLINLMQAIYPKDFKCYILTSEADTIYSILNLPSDDCMEQIESSIEKFLSALEYDKKYLKTTVTHGEIHAEIEGLVKSHIEATDKLGIFSGFNALKTDNSSNSSEKIIPFSAADESMLSNLLITCRTAEAKEAIETMMKNLMDKNVSESVIYNFFSSLLNLIFKIMQTKGIVYDENDKGNLEIINHILDQPIREVYDTIIKYVDIMTSGDDTKTRVDFDAVIQYIENHFTEDLSLDMIASQYNTTAKYLSKLIKEKLGIKFTDFLSDLRIQKAKTLLAKSKKTIDEIYVEAGFSNRTSFSRTFKAKTGLSPSEFRKFNKQ